MDFFPEVIPLPDSDDTLSGTESDEPAPALAQAPPKHGRGRPLSLKTQAAATKGNVFVVDFLSCRTHFALQNLHSGSLQVVPMVLGG